MFGKKSNADGLAAATWQELADGLSSTRDVAAEHAKDLGALARRRTSLAWDVLSGRPLPNRKWPMIRAALLGIAAGWGASEFYRRRRTDVDRAVAMVGNEFRGAKTSMDERLAKAKATPGSPYEKAKAAVARDNNSRDAMDVPA
jgi:hypothetical protein